MRRWVALLLCLSCLGASTGPTPRRGSSSDSSRKRPPQDDIPFQRPQRLSLKQSYQGVPRRVRRLPPGRDGFREAGLPPVRGVTIGPIESLLQPGRDYGSEPFWDTLGEVKRLGANWISLTVFGRVWDANSVGIDRRFERPFDEKRRAVQRAVGMAHGAGLRVLLVPHLWLESGQWRAEMVHDDPERFERWAKNYEQFAVTWATVARESQVDLFAVGVELRSWVTSSRAHRFLDVIARVRASYDGLLTYAANWDDVADTAIWGHLDLIGINAFYPLHWENDATAQQLVAGGERVRSTVEELSSRYEKPVLFTEFGYTTRKNTAIEPWLWPEQLGDVTADPDSQARAYAALLDALHGLRGFAGSLVWRMYADVSDLSQEPDWGFSPWGKPSLEVLRRTYRDPDFGDPPRFFLERP